MESLKKNLRIEEGDYCDVSIFLGSCAAVERVWSFAKYILTNTQTSMTPVLFDTYIFEVQLFLCDCSDGTKSIS